MTAWKVIGALIAAIPFIVLFSIMLALIGPGATFAIIGIIIGTAVMFIVGLALLSGDLP